MLSVWSAPPVSRRNGCVIDRPAPWSSPLGGRGVGGQKALPHAATPQHKHRPHGNAYRGPSLFHASSRVGFYLPSSSLSLALLMEFQRLFSFLCLFELLMQKCSDDSLKLRRRRRDRDGGMTQRRRDRKTEVFRRGKRLRPCLFISL